MSHRWALAEARPWNHYRSDAYMALVRGSGGFVRRAAEAVVGLGAASVISPPVSPTASQVWRDAGFESYIKLRLLSRPVSDPMDPPLHETRTDPSPDWDRLLQIDEAGFGRDWCASRLSLEEALHSAARSVLHTVDLEEGHVGFVISAVSGSTGYVQRIAVAPEFRRRGIGSSLLGASREWIRRYGGKRILLNTKPDNETAIDMYVAQGFSVLPDRLELLRYR